MKKAFITGITGQDGSYLAELLLQKGYEVHGLIRRSSSGTSLERIEHLLKNPDLKETFFLHDGDLADTSSLKAALLKANPDEIYNLAAMSDVRLSFDMPEYTADVDGLAVLRLLEIIRRDFKHARFYQASTSELFGKVQETPQTEKTPFYPRSPYGIAKLYAYWAVVHYREAHGLFACNGILFNHESPRRGENFVSRKITQGVAKIVCGLQKKIVLGNLDAKRDWGYAPDFVEGMWRMLQQEAPEDFVLATGKTSTVREFVKLAFREVDIEIEWEGSGISEVGKNRSTGEILIEISPQFFRPTEVDILIGDAALAKQKLGWQASTNLQTLVQLMIAHDITDVAEKNLAKRP